MLLSKTNVLHRKPSFCLEKQMCCIEKLFFASKNQCFVYDKDPQKPKKTKKNKKKIFLRSPGGDSDLAPESEMFVLFCFFGSLAVWGSAQENMFLLSKTRH